MTRFCSIFNQLLQLFPRVDFQQAVVATQAERHARGFTCWDQFVAMLFCQLGRAHSLREICGGLASCEGKLAHLGVAAPERRTLAYANAHRPWQLYRAGVLSASGAVSRGGGAEEVPLQKQTAVARCHVIDLCAEVFPWATYTPDEGRRQAPLHAGPRRVSADGAGDHRREAPRGGAGAAADVCARHDSGGRPRLSRLTRGSRR